MHKILLLFLFLLPLGAQRLIAQDLPNYLTEQEKILLKTYEPKTSPFGYTTPPASPVRTMAEWEELGACPRISFFQ